jgi:uncharacterized membrane protein
MSEPADQSARSVVRKAPRWMWAALILSLSLNLLVAGIVIGSVWAVKRGGYWDAPIAFERSRTFMRQLPEESRRDIRQVFFEHKPALAPHWREVREARIAIGRLIEGGNYSPEALNAAMDALFQKEMRARQEAKPMIAAMLARLTPEQRVRFLRIFLPYLDNAQGQPDVNLPQSGN